jgi:Holliday junction resolvase RusA-like endonuclease
MAKMSQKAEREAWTRYVQASSTPDYESPATKVNSIHFTVETEPIPQGSMAGICTTNAQGNPVAILKADNPRTHHYRQLVGLFARRALADAGIEGLFAGPGVPVRVSITFAFRRPRSAPRRTHHTVKPDIDKLARAAHDGMTGIIYADDAQVVSSEYTKIYDEPERVQITVQLVEQ